MSTGYYRFPTVHDETIVFVADDDLWSVPITGGIARRLTANLGSVSTPALSPDGALLAFTGQEDGETEVYCMPAIGGPAQRLTFLGANSWVVGWTPDGESITFSSNAAQPFRDLTYLYKVKAQGGQPEQLPTGPAVSISYGPQGGQVMGRNTTDLSRWKRYRGGRTGDLWVDSDGDGNWQRLLRLNGNVALPLWVGERIYFVSDHEGIGNIYSCAPSGEDLRRCTNHKKYYVRHPASDGKKIVYHAGADIYLFDPKTEQSEPVEIACYSPGIQRNRKFVNAAEYLETYDVHPQGHSVAVTTRGKPFVMANWEKAVVQQGLLQGVRYRLATWLKDGIRLAVIGDTDSEEFLEIHYADASAEPKILNSLDLGRVIGLVASPQKSELAVSNHRQELIVVDVEQQSARVIDRSLYRRIYDVSWSPDGQWLAYSFANTSQTRIIKICMVETGETWEVTQPTLHDISPSFDPDGRYLYFLSYRIFDPVYDNLHFDLNFPWGMRPYLITLQADLPDPFLPIPRAPGEKPPFPDNDSDDQPDDEPEEEPAELGDEEEDLDDSDEDDETTAQDSDDDDEEDEEDEQESDAHSSDTNWVKIDFEGITNRIVPLPVAEGRYGQIIGMTGKVLFSSYPIVSALSRYRPGSSEPPARGKIEVYNFESQSHDILVRSITNFDLSLDHKTLIYRSGNDLRVLKAGEKPDSSGSQSNRKTGWLDLDRIKVAVEPPAEWQQMFREAWRLQRDYFWTEDMSGVDWQQVYKRYAPLLERVATRSEFSDLLLEMQGELGTSHAYAWGGDFRPEPAYHQGLLGADFQYDPDTDSYQVTNIVQGDGWHHRTSSPLARVGLGIKPGDRLVAVNRRKVGQNLSPQALLVNQAGQEVLLTFVGQDGSEPFTISVETLVFERPARYREWVEANRRRVHQATDGRVGYVHIPDMGAPGYAEFHRGFLAEVAREGLIVDVRFNDGGHVSPLLIEKLRRKRLGYDISRWGQPDPYPPESVLGPMVAITNEHSASDGDMFSHVFKLAGLGPLVGTRTWGGVIGFSMNGVLADGGVTTQPQYAFWFQDVGWSVENYGTEPNIEVEIRPQDYMAGVDPQLDRAIAEIQKSLEENPPKLPDFGNRPRLILPTLPDVDT